MQKLTRAHYVAENYGNLQGLTSVPMGLFCLELFVLGMGWLILPGGWLFWSIGISIGLSIVATILYRLVYGHSRPLARVQRRDAFFAIGLAIGLAIALFLDVWKQPLVDLTELVLAGGLFLYYWPHRRFSIHYLVLAVIIACIGLLPLFGGVPDHSLFLCGHSACTINLGFGSHLKLMSQSPAAVLMRFLLSFAVLGIVGGCCDHFLLRYTFASEKRKNHGRTI